MTLYMGIVPSTAMDMYRDVTDQLVPLLQAAEKTLGGGFG